MASRHRTLLPLFAVLAAAFLLSFYRITSLDVFWHVKTGQVILETGRLLTTNTFSATYPDHPWPNPEWLFQVIVASLHDAGGWAALVIFKVAVALLLAVGLYSACLAAGGSRIAAASLTVLTLSALQFRFVVRPHLFSYLFLAVTVLAVERHRRRGGRAVWLLPPLFALWSNIHPELFIGLLFLGAVILGDVLDGKASRPLIISSLLCVPAALLNPETYHVLTFPFLHVFLGPVIEVHEYRRTVPAQAPVFWAFLGALVLVTAVQWRERTWKEILPLGGLALMGALWLRGTPYLFIAGAPVLSYRIGRIAGDPLQRHANLAAAVAAAAALAWATGYERHLDYGWGWGVMERNYPVAAADLLATGRFPPVLYNNYGEGSYLVYRLYPVMGVFQDGRLQAYPRAFASRLHAKFSLDDLPEIFREYGVNTALVHRDQTGAFDPREWGVVFWDDSWVVLVRRAEAHTELLEEYEYRLYLPGANVAAPADEATLAELAGEMVRNQGWRRHRSPVADSNLGTVYLRLGRLEEAKAALGRSVEAAPDYAPAWANMGMVRLAAGERGGAVRALEKALELDPALAGAKDLVEQIQRGEELP